MLDATCSVMATELLFSANLYLTKHSWTMYSWALSISREVIKQQSLLCYIRKREWGDIDPTKYKLNKRPKKAKTLAYHGCLPWPQQSVTPWLSTHLSLSWTAAAAQNCFNIPATAALITSCLHHICLTDSCLSPVLGKDHIKIHLK